MIDSTGTYLYEYDALNRLTKVTYPDNKVLEYTYDEMGNYNYKSRNTPSGVLYLTGLKTCFYIIFTGNRTAITENNGAKFEYNYDDIYQLTKEIRYDSVGDTVYGLSYVYDSTGNRLELKDLVSSDTKAYTYDNDNRMLSSGSDTFAYDLGGNMTEQKTDSGLTTYEWNYENMLTKITDPNSNVTEYTYNGLLQRTERNVSSSVTKFLWDGFNVIAEYDGSNNQTVKYIQSLQIDKPISQIRNNNYYYYLFDGLGSVTELTDASESIQNTYRYKAFGESLSKSENITNEFQYTSRRNENNGLDYNRFRYYYPAIARFSNWDLFNYGYGLNMYIYTINQPINYRDQYGLWKCSDFWNFISKALKGGIIGGGVAAVISQILDYKKPVDILKEKKNYLSKWQKDIEMYVKYEPDKMAELIKMGLIKDPNEILNDPFYKKLGITKNDLKKIGYSENSFDPCEKCE